MASIEEDLADRIARGEELVIATVVATGGSPPSQPGAKLLCNRAGPLAGTLGCSELDTAALTEAASTLDGDGPHLSRYTHDLGTVDVYLEPHSERPTLVVGGATPVAAAVLLGAREVGFRTLLVESRTERLEERSWPADVAPVGVQALESALPPRGASLYAVMTDHDSPDLRPLCAALLARRPRFLGLMGSRRHSARQLEGLRADGVPEAWISEIRTPVGLDLGARSPEEIAISIVAGLVAIRRGGRGGWLHDRAQTAPPGSRAGHGSPEEGS